LKKFNHIFLAEHHLADGVQPAAGALITHSGSTEGMQSSQYCLAFPISSASSCLGGDVPAAST